ncbi:MAG: AsmA-like C-terminal region-containing protein [Leeuwenhoekiella sp.]
MKKFLKITGITVLVLLLILMLTPIIFKGKLEDLLKKEINKNVNATVTWEEIDLSLLRNFPDASLTIENFSVVNKAPFAGDTLAKGERLSLQMGITQLFKGGGEPIAIDALVLDKALVNIKVDSLGNANYDIAIADTTAVATTSEVAATTSEGGFTMDLKHYELNNSRINYLDESTKTFLRLVKVNHEGNGDLSASQSTLATTTEAFVSFELDSINYLNKNRVTLTADIGIDLEKQRYTFMENEAMVNQLPLVFEGYVQVNENNNEVDLTFETPSSDFKNFLAVIPEEYSKNLDGVTTSGDFQVNGSIKGVVDETYIPKLNIAISSNNASFKYPDLPKSVEDIVIDARVMNETGLVDDTYLEIGNMKFRIDQDVFQLNGRIDRLTTNPLVDMAAKGKLNLGNLEKAYPLELDQDINGLLTIDATAKFDMESVEKEQYQNINTNGTARLSNFVYTSPELPQPLSISTAAITFNPGTITLNEMNAKTGSTDLSATGSIANLIPFMLSDDKLKGRFNIQSNTVNLADFGVIETETAPTENDVASLSADRQGAENTSETSNAAATSSSSEAIKIPAFLDAILDFSANKIIYDNITLNNAKGTLRIQDETATLENISSDLFGGRISLNGNVSTKTTTPTFKMALNLDAVGIAESFQGMEMLQQMAPIAKALQGKLNTTIDLNGNLNADLTPILTSLAGDALAQLLTAKVDPDKMPLLQNLSSKLNFINLEDLNLDNLKAQFSFNDGRVDIKPIDFEVKNIGVTVNGSHNFDNTMNYNLALDVPARLLGSSIGGALANFSSTDLDNYSVDLPVQLTGTFTNPQVSVNVQQAANDLTQKIIAEQKGKLQKQGEDKIKDVLGGILGGKKTTDSTATKTDSTQATPAQTAKNVFGKLIKKATKKDTTSN